MSNTETNGMFYQYVIGTEIKFLTLKDGQVFVRHGGGYEFLTIIMKRSVQPELRKILKRMDE